MDTAILMWVRELSTPALDVTFRFSHQLGTFGFCVFFVAAAVLWCLARQEARIALVWVVVGATTYFIPELLKLAIARPRPTLWPWLVQLGGFSCPSGHAVVGTAFYPLLAWDALRSSERLQGLSYALGFLPAVFIGVGRLYLGVHWPSDVVAGWALGTVLSAGAIVWIEAGEEAKRHAGATS
jgi:membrane-associated phospholipid phosphatase